MNCEERDTVWIFQEGHSDFGDGECIEHHMPHQILAFSKAHAAIKETQQPCLKDSDSP